MVNFAAPSAEQARILSMRRGQSPAVLLIFGAPKPYFLSCTLMLENRWTPIKQFDSKAAETFADTCGVTQL
jgi:hypothetical protein